MKNNIDEFYFNELLENNIENIESKKNEYELYKENFLKEFKFLLLNGFFMNYINFDFHNTFIYSDNSFKKLYLELYFPSYHLLNMFMTENIDYLVLFDFNINSNKTSLILQIDLFDLFDMKIHYFYKNNRFFFFFTLFFPDFHISLYHPDNEQVDMYDILYDGFLLLECVDNNNLFT